MTNVLMLASGHSALQYFEYNFKENGWIIVSVNNGWTVIPDEWDYWVRSNDYKGSEPQNVGPRQIIVPEYGPSLDKFGGHDKCGYSMALAAAYWALDKLEPTVIGFLGADMNYTPDKKGNTHVYGIGYDIMKRGIPDPDRMAKKYGKNDPNYLQNLYKRFENVAIENGCRTYNISHTIDTRLPYERRNPKDI